MRLYCFADSARSITLTWAHGSESAHSTSWGDLLGMNRGDRREASFEDDEDRERLWQTLAEARQKCDRQVYASTGSPLICLGGL
jgi:hypothetical protein